MGLNMKIKGIKVFRTGDLVEDNKRAKFLFAVTKTASGGIRVVFDNNRKEQAENIFENFSKLKGLKGKTLNQDPDNWFQYMLARTQNMAFITHEIEAAELNSSYELKEDEDASTLQYKLDI
ncbi:MAG: hypothetical protein DHS20C13_29560 [Thermodesulfobacteriota bacterium]|nr:MAG: hypothetical protein DHS20C13_29560 [Thermodesulfobacteriota bacterium]